MNLKSNRKFMRFYEWYMSMMGIGGHSALVLQAIRIISVKSSHDVSLGGCFISLIAIVSWLFYGFLKEDKTLIRVNLVGIFCGLFCLFTTLFFRF